MFSELASCGAESFEVVSVIGFVLVQQRALGRLLVFGQFKETDGGILSFDV